MDNIKEKVYISFESLDNEFGGYYSVNLRQAIHWIAFGLRPVKKEYEKAYNVPLEVDVHVIEGFSPDETEDRINKAKALLFTALREGYVRAYSFYCYKYNSDYAYEIPPSKVKYSVNKQSIYVINKKDKWGFYSYYDIPKDDWKFVDIEWDMNCLIKDINHKGETYDYLAYTDIEIDVDYIKDIKLDDSVSQKNVDNIGVETKKGRPTKYDWDTFYCEVIRIANSPDGLPDTPAELKNTMLDWFNEKYNAHPTDSLIRTKISKIYSYKDSAKK